MKHNLLKSVILSVILLMGVSNAWGIERIYLKLETWKNSGARYAAYFYNNGGKEYWQNMYETSVSQVFACDIPSDGVTYNKVIFVRLNPSGTDNSNGGNNWNNKWNQSENITFQKNKLCTQGNNWDSWTGSWSAITWYITGSFNDWKTNNSATSYTLNANTTYEFKVYSPQVGYFSNEGTMDRGNHSNWDMFANVGNCKLTTDIAGTYILTYNGDKMNVTYPEQCFLKGSFNKWEETHSILNGSVTVTLAAGTHTFKIYRYDNSHGTPYWCGNSGTMSRGNSFEWVMQSDISDDCKLTADRDGDYTFEYDRSTGKLTVKYPGEDYYLTGDFNSWASNTSSSFISNNSITVPLTKGIHEFKIHHIAPLIDAHYGNNGTMTRVECTGWTMETEKDNCKIEADITGDYIFTFDKSTKKVTVEYPEYGEKKTIYLNINEQPTWVDADAKMAVRYDGTNYEMTPIGCDAKGHYLYSCDNVPVEKNIKFVRINPNNTSEIWNESSEYAVPAGNNLNCFKMTGWGTGNWTTFEEIYPVTLDPHTNYKNIDFGSYSVRYNGTTYTSKPTETVTFYASAGAQIEILEGDPINDAYLARVRAQAGAYNSIYGDDIAGYAGQTITVCGRTSFDNEFLTRASHVVYLGVPNSDTFKKWRDTGYKYFIWLKDCPDGGLKENTGDPFTIGSTTYYKFEIPAGNRNFEFQRKVENNGDQPHVKTIDFPYEIPTTNVNCFTLTSENDGYWDMLPAQEGDYRLLYVEQQVAKEDWKTVIDTTYQHSSDFIRKNVGGTDIVSLHVERDEKLNPEIILQQMENGVWVDLERHMVMGPLQTDNAGAAMLPGRRNATGNLIYDDGIEVIKNDGTYPGRVYNFKVQQFTSATTADTAKLLLGVNDLEPYEGNYYIRTDNAVGGWNQYLTSGNVMNYSKYAEDHSGFSHYFCKYVDIAEDPKNVKFVIANDHGTAISDTLNGDDFVPKENNGSIFKGELQESANVRWSWNQYTNEVKRAYIKGSSANNFLTVTQESGTTTEFKDNGNWIYEADITAKVNEKITAITAPYNNQNQSLLEETYQTGGMPMLTGDEENNKNDYTVRVQYDFKINKTVALLIPGEHTIASAIDVLIEREDQGGATQVSVPITASNTENGYTVYAVMSFTQDHIEGSGTQSEKLYYWVSFPFDVRISDVFGFGEYGVHWIMEYYDGAERAEKGCWADSPTYWRYITDTTSVDIPDNNKNLNCGILKANQGYVLALALNIANMGIFTNTDKVSLYFPSMEPIKDQIDESIIETTVELAPYTCTIERDDRYIHDSNWHIIGVPSFSDKQQTLTNNLLYYYTRDQKNDKYIATSTIGSSITFKSLHSYMVQYAGTINWATWTLQPQGLVAKRNAETEKTHSLRLELSQNGTYNDQTLVTLQEEGATEAFDMNLDLSKMMNTGNNIYTLAGDELIQVAGNSLPIANTVIPVGVQIATAGEYTFAMPDGTDGIVVELIDYDTNTTTNLMLDEYTVNLAAGTNESRFALSVKPDKTTTSLEDININSNGVKKYLIDGVLYLQKDGLLYDAQGKLVR